MSEPRGCLGFLLRIFGPTSDTAAPVDDGDVPFRLRDDFLSAAEQAFYRVLVQAAGQRATVLAKVNLADLFFVPRSESFGQMNRINRKHVDFLLCRPDTMKPLCGIELDDASHSRPSRQKRDDLVDRVFEAAALPLVRVRAAASYDVKDVAAQIRPHLEPQAAATAAEPDAGGEPLCPKCGLPMVLRESRRGPRAGERVYGCPNYPKCRETRGA